MATDTIEQNTKINAQHKNMIALDNDMDEVLPISRMIKNNPIIIKNTPNPTIIVVFTQKQLIYQFLV